MEQGNRNLHPTQFQGYSSQAKIEQIKNNPYSITKNIEINHELSKPKPWAVPN